MKTIDDWETELMEIARKLEAISEQIDVERLDNDDEEIERAYWKVCDAVDALDDIYR